MPIIKSAKKRVRVAEVRQMRNNQTRSMYRSAIKKIKDLLHDKKIDDAQAALPAAYKAIDMAAKKNVLHKNTAAHRKSSLATAISEAAKN